MEDDSWAALLLYTEYIKRLWDAQDDNLNRQLMTCYEKAYNFQVCLNEQKAVIVPGPKTSLEGRH